MKKRKKKKERERETRAYLLGLLEVVPTVKGEGVVLVITERKEMQCSFSRKKKLQKLMNRYWSCDEQQKPQC
jgi:hypothetical protein